MSVLGWRYKGDGARFVGIGDPDDQVVRSLAGAVLRRDGYQCKGCGFKSLPSVEHPCGYMEIFPIDRNYSNLVEDNWAAACPFCHASLALINALKSKRYTLIVTPQIEQMELFNLVRPMLIVLTNPSHIFFREAAVAYEQLLATAVSVPTVLPGIPTTESTPEENIIRFLELLDSTITDEQYKQRSLFLNAIRLLPLKGKFNSELHYWDAAFYKKYPARRWECLPEAQ